ncbi:MAG: DNA internalization-related competence protein ComEC/Rec2 [Pseudomonadota bacterium]|jgi:competence protein ComEC
MRTGIALPSALALLGGVLSVSSGFVQQFPGLFLAVYLLAGLRVANRYASVLPFWLLWGIMVALLTTEQGRALPAGLSGSDVSVEAKVLSVSDDNGVARLTLRLLSCASPPGQSSCQALGKVRVSAYQDIRFQPGERWEMTLRLRPPRGFSNPDTFDYQSWLWRERLNATGYVRRSPPAIRLAESAFSLRRLGLEYLTVQALSERSRRWLAALTLGDSEQLERQDWDLLNHSGTTHLVVISGLHVGLVATFSLLLARLVARLISPGNWRLRAWPWWLAAASTVAYATLAGLAPPALRAMLMALVGLWVASGRHAPGPWQAWWLALALVIILDPLAAWRPGFWLSFVAVAWLIVIWHGRPRPRGLRGWLWALVRTQLLLAPLMAGAVLFAFGRLAPLAPLINLLAVPWVSLVMVPSAMLGWLLIPVAPLSELSWWVFEQALNLFHGLLTLNVTYLPLWEPSSSHYKTLGVGFIWLALCWGLPATSWMLRAFAVVTVSLLAVWPREESWPDGALRVRVMDVGQGQLVELRSQHQRMLYDTGPRFRSGFMPLDTLWPGGQRFDQVVVSHADNDHAGGISALLDGHKVIDWWLPKGEEPDVSPMPTPRSCYAGQRWSIDDIGYHYLWPPPGKNKLSANDRSCVLHVTVGEHSLLLTGDVGVNVERRLLTLLDTSISVLVAGHHGSNTSSGEQFVRYTQAHHVVFSAGRDNAFGHPTQAVVRRFRRAGSCLWNTAHDGALTFWLIPGETLSVTPQRELSGKRQRC